MNKEKIQKVIEKMLTDHTKIKSVTRSSNDFEESMEEYYFTFPDEKYLWSISQNAEGNNFIFYYPSKEDHSEFIRVGADDIANDYFLKEDLKKLFGLMKGKLFGFDGVLDDILNEDASIF